MAAMDGFRRMFGLRVEADERARAILDTYDDSDDLVRCSARIMSTQTREMPASQILHFLPGLGDNAALPRGVQRQAAVLLEAERVINAHLAPRHGDGPLHGRVRKEAYDQVKRRTEIFMGGGLEGHLNAETEKVGRAVEAFLSTGPARDRSYAIQAAALHADVVGRRPDLTVRDVETHVRAEAAKALTGNLSEKTGERVAGWVVSQAMTPYAARAIEEAGVMADPMRVGHLPKTDSDWMDVADARRVTGLVALERAAPTPTKEAPAPSRGMDAAPARSTRQTGAAMEAARSAMGR